MLRILYPSKSKPIQKSHSVGYKSNQLNIPLEIWYIVHEFLADRELNGIKCYVIEFNNKFEYKGMCKPIELTVDAIWSFGYTPIGRSLEKALTPIKDTKITTGIFYGMIIPPFLLAAATSLTAGAAVDGVRHAHHSTIKKHRQNKQLEYVYTLFGKTKADCQIVEDHRTNQLHVPLRRQPIKKS